VTQSFHLPLVLDGNAIEALVVGGGQVAFRRSRALLEAGAVVRVVARDVIVPLHDLAANHPRLTIAMTCYVPSHIGDAQLVVAATDDGVVNAQVARDARARHRLVNVADAPELGNVVMPAVHRSEDLLIAVSAGGAPGVAVKLRDVLAARFDSRYGTAVRQLAKMRRRLLDSGERERWQSAAKELVADDFCEAIESGTFSLRLAEWR
jgi:siroheme synthase-like protein